MPAKNEILPLDAGPSRHTITAPAKATKAARNAAANADATTSQERRIRLVAAQRRHTAFQLFYGVFGIALMVVQMEYLWFANTQDFDGVCLVDPVTQCPQCLASLTHSVPVADGRMLLHALRVLISFSTLILLYYVHAFYAAECEVLKIKNIVPPKATLLSSPLRGRLLFELLLCVVHPFPGLESLDPRWPNLVVASSLVMLTRLFLLFRVVQFRNSFNSSNGWFIGALTNVDFTSTFFLKSTLKNHPSKCIVVSFVLLLLTTGYSLYVVERFLCAFHATACCVPMAFTDALWALVITMLTIGYGDVVPHTPSGRFFAVLAGLCGTIFMAVTIAVMSSYLVLTRSEHKVNAFLKKDENRRLINEHAARAIQAYVALRAVQRRHFGAAASKRGAAAIAKAERKLYDVLRVYRQVKRFVNSHDVSDPMDKQMTMLEMMEVNVEYIRTKIEDLGDLFQSQVDKQAKSKRKITVAVTAAAASSAFADAGNNNSSTTTTTAAAAAAGTMASTAQTPVTAGSTAAENTAPMPRPSDVPGQTPILDGDAEPARPRSARPDSSSTDVVSSLRRAPSSGSNITACASTAAPSSCAPQVAMLSQLTAGSSRALKLPAPDVSEVPEWAVAMESSLQSILSVVQQVSGEMDTLRTRVASQMDSLQSRVGDLEKRLGVQDAFREISRKPSIRRTLNRQASGHSDHADGSGAIVGTSDATAAAVGANGGSFSLATATRYNRKSFALRQPSIQNFVTPKDLEEFQNSVNMD